MSGKMLSQCADAQQVKRLLRRRGSLEYFKNGGWTEDPEEARSFTDAVEIAEACAQYSLVDVEVALRYNAGTNDLFCTTVR
jgi:hypothetical protein